MSDKTNKPKLIQPAHDEPPISIEKPEAGGLQRFKSKRSPNIAGVETLLTALPHHKISEAGDFVRLHPNEEEYWSPYQLTARAPNLWIGETSVQVVWDEPMERCGRAWFECPVCKRRARHLYLRSPIACRRCHGLQYLAENRQQTRGVGRVERLRRRLGNCDTRPFAPLPARRPGRSKAFHERMVAMIQDEEAKLVEHLGGIVHDLKRRIRVRKSKGKW